MKTKASRSKIAMREIARIRKMLDEIEAAVEVGTNLHECEVYDLIAAKARVASAVRSSGLIANARMGEFGLRHNGQTWVTRK